MKVSIYFTGKNRKEQVLNAKKEGFNFLLTVASSSSDWEHYFKTENEAVKYCADQCGAHINYIEEKCTIWDLNDEKSNKVLFEN